MNLLLLSRRKTLCCSQYCRVTSLILKTSGLDFYYCDLLQCISVLAVTRRGWKDFLLLFHAVSRKTPTGCYTGCAARAPRKSVCAMFEKILSVRLFARGLSRVRAICNVPRLQVERELSRFAVTCLECALVSNTVMKARSKHPISYLP